MNDYIIQMISGESLQPLLPEGAAPMRVTVKEMSKLTSWPVEDGTQRTDHRVIDPIEIDIPMMLHSEGVRETFERLREIYIRGDDITVQTRMRTYEGMMIYEMPHDETSEAIDAVTVNVKLKQVITVKPEFGTLPPSKVANKKQSSTVKKGGQQTTESDKKKSSTLYGFLN